MKIIPTKGWAAMALPSGVLVDSGRFDWNNMSRIDGTLRSYHGMKFYETSSAT